MSRTSDNQHNVSDELLNSFIDQQIADEEREELLALIEQDETLANRLRELQRIKDLTRLAYNDIPVPSSQNRQYPRQRQFPLAASIAIFSLGLLLGLGIMQMKPHAQVLPSLSADQSQTRVLVHLTSGDVDAGLNTLDNIQQMLQDYARKQQHVVVEVVANGNGINLLTTANRKMAMRIAELTTRYDNVSFAACKNTINQMKVSKGLDIQLIPQVRLIDSGIVNVIKRQSQGWTYIRG